MYGLDLFSGIGGITKALDGYVRPVAYCEIDQYARGVLLSRMASGDLPVAPIWDDVTTLHGSMLPPVDIIYGGFPCQDISVAGRQKGLDGKRSGLFFEIVRLIREIKPSFVFLENVPNIRVKGLGRVIKELESVGYDCRWGLLSAADVGANHKRERWFLLANTTGARRVKGIPFEGWTVRDETRRKESERLGGYVGDASGVPGAQKNPSARAIGEGGNARSNDGGADGRAIPGDDWWLSEPCVGRMANGVSGRVERLRALGNGVVPSQVREAFERLSGIKNFNGDRFTRV